MKLILHGRGSKRGKVIKHLFSQEPDVEMLPYLLFSMIVIYRIKFVQT